MSRKNLVVELWPKTDLERVQKQDFMCFFLLKFLDREAIFFPTSQKGVSFLTFSCVLHVLLLTVVIELFFMDPPSLVLQVDPLVCPSVGNEFLQENNHMMLRVKVTRPNFHRKNLLAQKGGKGPKCTNFLLVYHR